MTPAGRFAKPIEVAYLALYLATDESAFLTGTVLPIDGGFLAR
jgi:NAD(P)-dependent dehydrogenase (short-subunit alcohol dehydrogenase family)